MDNKKLDVNQAIETLLWSSSSIDEHGEEVFGLELFTTSLSLDKQVMSNLREFWNEVKDFDGIETVENLEHDFVLTANGHGAGFWDRDYDQKLIDGLCEAAKNYQMDVYIGNDEYIYLC